MRTGGEVPTKLRHLELPAPDPSLSAAEHAVALGEDLVHRGPSVTEEALAKLRRLPAHLASLRGAPPAPLAPILHPTGLFTERIPELRKDRRPVFTQAGLRAAHPVLGIGGVWVHRAPLGRVSVHDPSSWAGSGFGATSGCGSPTVRTQKTA